MNENEKLEMNESEDPITEDFVENPFSFEKDESAGDYPLTLEELKAVARHWWEQYIDTGVCCWMFNTTGGIDLQRFEYASRRLKRIEKILGEEVSEKVYQEVQETFRKRLGDETWQAYLGGYLVFREDTTEEERAYWERLKGKPSWVYKSILVET
jgi:hypothetical protein